MLIAYHNDVSIKAKLLASLHAHASADQIIQGQYWENNKGCAVACTLVDFDLKAARAGAHEAYETIFGISQALARLEDRIFEGLQNGEAKEWPLRFASAVQPGADLSMVVPKLIRLTPTATKASLPR